MKIKHSEISRKGYGKASNEDSIIVKKIENGFIFAAADGLGGLSHGKIASLYAVEKIAKASKDIEKSCDLKVTLERVFNDIDDELRFLAGKMNNKIGTTLTLMVVTGENYYIAHVGDTRVYEIRKDKVYLLTRDDSWLQDEIEKGEIDINDLLRDPRANMLTQCLGEGKKPKVRLYKGEVRENSIYLLCSDGFRRSLSLKSIARIYEKHESGSSFDAILDSLSKVIEESEERDDHSAIIFTFRRDGI